MSKWKGNKLELNLYGTSHDEKIGIVVKGLPKIKINNDKLISFMARRQGGKGLGTTERKETDEPQFIRGVVEGKITDDEVEAVIFNKNKRSNDYNDLYGKPRPSHADYVSYIKEGTLDYRGGGRFSGRLTAPLTVVGGILEDYFSTLGVKATAYIRSVGDIKCQSYKDEGFDLDTLPPNGLSASAIDEIEKARKNKDSVGAVVECVIRGVRSGIGNDYFEGLESSISSLIYAIPGVKGVEFGEGFDLSKLHGSAANDPLCFDENGNIRTLTNNAGGINGGISNGEDITLSIAFRPTPSISKSQNTVDLVNKTNTTIEIKGRHDCCIAIRALPVVESMCYIALFDAM